MYCNFRIYSTWSTISFQIKFARIKHSRARLSGGCASTIKYEVFEGKSNHILPFFHCVCVWIYFILRRFRVALLRFMRARFELRMSTCLHHATCLNINEQKDTCSSDTPAEGGGREGGGRIGEHHLPSKYCRAERDELIILLKWPAKLCCFLRNFCIFWIKLSVLCGNKISASG